MTDAEEAAFVEEIIPKIRTLSSFRGRIIDAATQAMGGSGLVGSWVSVEKRMPEENEDVLVACEQGIRIAQFWKDPNMWMDMERGTCDNVTHWARIREPKR